MARVSHGFQISWVLGCGNIFVNVCGNRVLSLLRGQRDFRLRGLGSLYGFLVGSLIAGDPNMTWDPLIIVYNMSFHKNTRKEDLINVLKEIGEQATSKETIIELKTKLEKSAAFKDDPDFVINLLNLSVEDRQAKAERHLQETNSQLELEKIKLQQIEREIELQKTLAEGQATRQGSKGDTNNLETLIKSVKTLTTQIPTKTENFGLFSNP
ncbi:integrase catalytic domain-containing protein [Trichonephila clavipes]|nr:integrase catalytic domain-containing protein [Trichonephila clavipes]